MVWCIDHTIRSLWLVIFWNHLSTHKRWDVFISVLQIKKLWISKFRMCRSQMTRKQWIWAFNHACRTFKVHAISGLFLDSIPLHHLLFKLFLVWLVGFCCYCCLFVVVLLVWFILVLFCLETGFGWGTLADIKLITAHPPLPEVGLQVFSTVLGYGFFQTCEKYSKIFKRYANFHKKVPDPNILSYFYQ